MFFFDLLEGDGFEGIAIGEAESGVFVGDIFWMVEIDEFDFPKKREVERIDRLEDGADERIQWKGDRPVSFRSGEWEKGDHVEVFLLEFEEMLEVDFGKEDFLFDLKFCKQRGMEFSKRSDEEFIGEKIGLSVRMKTHVFA